MSAQKRHEEFVLQYVERNVTTAQERAAVRCGLSDAAHLCDAMANDLEATGRKSKERAALVAMVRKCGDAIWQLRDRVKVDATRSALDLEGRGDEA